MFECIRDIFEINVYIEFVRLAANKMKVVLYISFTVLFSNNIRGQDTIFNEFKNYLPYSSYEGSELKRNISSDSIKIELRLWICNFLLPDKLIQIRQTSDLDWDFKHGYFKFIDSRICFAYKSIDNLSIDWDNFEKKLNDFMQADVPDQKKIELIKKIEDKSYHIKNSAFFTNVMDGVEFTIELFYNDKYKIIHYNNPHSYLEDLEKSGFSTTKHKDFIKFVEYLTEEFELNRLFALQLNEIYDNSEK